MAAQRFEDYLFSYSGLISSSEEIQLIREYFNEIHRETAQAECSEIIDLRKYSNQRHPLKIRNLLRSGRQYPFVFVNCLN